MTLLTETPTHTNQAHTGPWRLMMGAALPGALNMAIDEALLESVIEGGPPVLRFYTWEPAALSLGVNQSIHEIDWAACEARGFGLVRRITGGRAVLHQHELTYSVIARENDPRVSGGVIESYRKVSAALVAGLQLLRVDVQLAPPNRALIKAMSEGMRHQELDEQAEGSHGAVCFDAASAYELTAHGRKLVGSAQARRGGALLQHGSILLDIDWDAWVNVFAYASEAGRQRAHQKLPMRMISLKQELGREVTGQEVSYALIRGFEKLFKIELQVEPPTQAEARRAEQLAEEKYSSTEWTGRS